MYVVASRSKIRWTEQTRQGNYLEKESAVQFLTTTGNPFKLPEWARINLENTLTTAFWTRVLWQALGAGEEGCRAFAECCNYIYLDTDSGGTREDYDALQGPVRSIYHRPTCKAQKTVHPDCGSG